MLALAGLFVLLHPTIMSLNNVTPGSKTPEVFNVVIEISANSAPVKYEVDKESGCLFVDRFLGTAMHYPVNYGYVPGVMAGDNAEQDVYILGPTEPLKTFDGVVIAVVHRFNDVEDKWVAAEKTGVYTAEEILKILDFQEKYYESELIL